MVKLVVVQNRLRVEDTWAHTNAVVKWQFYTT